MTSSVSFPLVCYVDAGASRNDKHGTRTDLAVNVVVAVDVLHVVLVIVLFLFEPSTLLTTS